METEFLMQWRSQTGIWERGESPLVLSLPLALPALFTNKYYSISSSDPLSLNVTITIQRLYIAQKLALGIIDCYSSATRQIQSFFYPLTHQSTHRFIDGYSFGMKNAFQQVRQMDGYGTDPFAIDPFIVN